MHSAWIGHGLNTPVVSSVLYAWETGIAINQSIDLSPGDIVSLQLLLLSIEVKKLAKIYVRRSEGQQKINTK